MKRMTMLTLTLTLALTAAAALPSPAPAAEQIELKPAAGPKLTKAERIEKLKQEIFRAERTIARVTPEYIARQEKSGDTKGAAAARANLGKARAALPAIRTELAWLEGRLTLAACEKQVKDLESTLEKAGPAEKPPIQTALDEARAQLAAVKKLETEKDF